MIRVSVAPSASSWARTSRAWIEQVAGVEPHRAELGPGDLDGGRDRRRHVVGVDQQGRARAQAGDLRRERLALVVVQQGERVRARCPAVGTP